MKYLSTIIIIIAINQSIIAQINSGTIEYKKTFISKNFTKENNKSLAKEKLNRFSKIEERIKNAQKNISFKLLFTKKESIFKANPILDRTTFNLNNLAIGPDGSGVFYNSNKIKIRQLNTFGEDFLISSNQIVWTLENQTKKIAEYTCYKAIAIEKVKTRNGIKNYKIVAWYYPKINVPYGPLGFSNLPGIILELERRNIKYYATKINLNPKKKIVIKRPTKGKRITHEEFFEIGIKAMGNFKKK